MAFTAEERRYWTQQLATLEKPTAKPSLLKAFAPLFRPSERVRESVTEAVTAKPITPLLSTPILSAFLPRGPRLFEALRQLSAQEERKRQAELLGSLVAAPIDPTTYAFGVTSAIRNPALRAGTSAAVGAVPELTRERPSAPHAAVQGTLAGALGLLVRSARPAVRPTLSRAPRFAPESVLIPPKPVSASEIAQSIEELQRTITKPPAQSQMEALEGMFPGLFKESRARGGFVALPEEEPVKRAGRQIFGRAVVSEATKPLRPKHPLSLEAVETAAGRAVETIEQNPNSMVALQDGRKVFQRITEGIMEGEIDVTDFPKLLKGYNLTPQEFGVQFARTISTAGKELNVLSRFAQRTLRALPKETQQAIEQTLGKKIRPPDAYDRIRDGLNTLTNVWRASLVSQLATAMRNGITQSGRYSLKILDDAFVGTGMAMSGKQTAREALTPALEDIYAVFRGITRALPTKSGKAQRQALTRALENQPIEAARLFGTVAGDVGIGGKYRQLVTSFNRLQEFFIRRVVVDAELSAHLRPLGKTLETAVATDFDDEMFRQAVNKALEVTWARPVTSQAGRHIMGLLHEVPLLYTFPGLTFPRWMANSWRFLADYSPGGFAKLLSPTILREVATGEPKRALGALSKATLGTMLYGTGWALRNPKFAGERWYQTKVLDEKGQDTGKRNDWRPFFPLPQYMFVGELLRQSGLGKSYGAPLTGRDMGEAVLGMSRLAGTGLFFFDFFTKPDQRPERLLAGFQQYLGQFLGGFSVPLRTAADFIGEYSPEDAFARSATDNPLTDPFLRNVPGANRALPPAQAITRQTPFQREEPLLRQLTGITQQSVNPLERESVRLGLNRLNAYTGMPKLDRLINAKAAQLVEPLGTRLVQSPGYQALDDFERAELIKGLVSESKKAAKQKVLQEDATLVALDVLRDLKGESVVERKKTLARWKNKGVLSESVLRELVRLKQLVGSLEPN